MEDNCIKITKEEYEKFVSLETRVGIMINMYNKDTYLSGETLRILFSEYVFNEKE